MLPYGLILKGGLALGKHLLGGHLPAQFKALKASGPTYPAWETAILAGGWRVALGAGITAYSFVPVIRHCIDQCIVAITKAAL